MALFRALPGSELSRIAADIGSFVDGQTPFSIQAEGVFRMKKGVGIHVRDHAGKVEGIYQALKTKWEEFLSEQDRSFRAHYTVQNKVEDEAIVQRTMGELKDGFEGSPGTVLGLRLWKYERGFWRWERDFVFGAGG